MSHFSESHSFNLFLACKYSVDEALLIQHFQFWIRFNRINPKNNTSHIHSDKCWTYQTREQIQSYMPYWSVDQVRRLCDKLVERGVLVKHNFNKKRFDKTIWYAFGNEKEFGVDEETVQKMFTFGKFANGVGDSAHGSGNFPQPIPDTKPYAKENRERGGMRPSHSLSNSSNEDNINNQQLMESQNSYASFVQHNIDYKTNNSDQVNNIIINDCTKNKQINSKCKFQDFGEFVKLKPEDYERLCNSIGKNLVNSYIQKINDYLLSLGKKPYKCYAAAIRQWHRRDIEEGKIKPDTPHPVPKQNEKIQKYKKYVCNFIKDNWEKMQLKGICVTDHVTYVNVNGNIFQYLDNDFKEKFSKEMKKIGYELQ